MTEVNNFYSDNLKNRRDFFYLNFPMIKIGRQRVDVNSLDILKNTCPVCGYLTLDERDSFEICCICFWEDDGIDDTEANEESGPNHMTLIEGRQLFQKTKQRLLTTNFEKDSVNYFLKDKFLNLDLLITQQATDKDQIVKLQEEIIDIMRKNKIYGLDKIFDN